MSDPGDAYREAAKASEQLDELLDNIPYSGLGAEHTEPLTAATKKMREAATILVTLVSLTNSAR